MLELSRNFESFQFIHLMAHLLTDCLLKLLIINTYTHSQTNIICLTQVWLTASNFNAQAIIHAYC